MNVPLVLSRSPDSGPLLLWLALFVGANLPALHGQIRINEIMASNTSVIADEDGDYEDWIELYNAGEAPVSLEGWRLSDNYERPGKWIFPEIIIGPNGYMVVWASGKDRQGSAGVHTNFRIKAAGEEVTLFDAEGIQRDEMEPREIPANVSLGRKKDSGVEWFYFAEPTPGAENSSDAYIGLTPAPIFSHPAGFYEEPLELSIFAASDDSSVYARMDGGAPTITPERMVSGTILIENREGHPNVIANIPTSLPEHGWQQPSDADVPKATVIRAMAVKPGHLPSSTASRTFFVGLNFTEPLPVVSLMADSAHFFDPGNRHLCAG